MADEWSPPRRNTEDPDRPPLPGMERSAPRIHPGSRLYHQAGNAEVWGHLAHPSLQKHNPFLNHIEVPDDYGSSDRGSKWRQESGGRTNSYEDWREPPTQGQDAAEAQIRKNIGSAHPAIAVSRHGLQMIAHSGRVKSQFETHTSGGLLDPDERADVEHKYFGYPKDLPVHARPIYGYLTHNPLAQHPGASMYGDHTLILHRPRVFHRTSAFIGDTLDDQFDDYSAHPAQDFRLSGVPHWTDPREHNLDQTADGANYTEAHYHGGLGLRDIHYAVLRAPDSWSRKYDQDGAKKHEALKEALNQRRIPWVESDRGKPIDWNKHEARIRLDIMKGAIMQPKHQMSVIGQQGEGRYLIDLGYENEHGHQQAQIADMESGVLHPPASKDSILARGYWEDPHHPVDVDEVLPHVTPR